VLSAGQDRENKYIRNTHVEKNDGLYLSLDEARKQLHKRWCNTELKQQIEVELGDRLWPAFSDKPRAVLFRQLISPDNGFTFFYQCAKYINAAPYCPEYQGDIFVSFNVEKKGLGRLRLTLEDGTRACANIMDFYAHEKKKLSEVVLKTGESLVDFHHGLLKMTGYDVEVFDNTQWLYSIGSAAEYYYYYLLHCVAHGVLFEKFEGDEHETDFANTIVVPAIERIKKKTGLSPMVVMLYPEHQDELEGFYWWSYPPHINNHLIDYVQRNNLKIKPCKF
jgi:hypothetical protein